MRAHSFTKPRVPPIQARHPIQFPADGSKRHRGNSYPWNEKVGRMLAKALEEVGTDKRFPVAYSVKTHDPIIKAWEEIAGTKRPDIDGIDVVVCSWPQKGKIFETAPTEFFWFRQGRMVDRYKRQGSEAEREEVKDLPAGMTSPPVGNPEESQHRDSHQEIIERAKYVLHLAGKREKQDPA